MTVRCPRGRLARGVAKAVVPLLGLLVSGFAPAAPAAGAEARRSSQSSTDTLRYDPWVHAPLTAAAAAGWLIPETQKGQAPCRWCERDSEGADTQNGLDAAVRRAWRWEDRNAAKRASDLGLRLAMLVPMAALAITHGGVRDGFGKDVLIVLEATAITGALTQAAKFGLRRERPWAHHGEPPPGEELGSAESNLSFFSGHASATFALAASTGAVVSIRGYRGAPWIWGAGLSVAAVTGYLRIAADRHYFTDVLTGAAVGVAVGVAVPYLLHRAREPDDAGPDLEARHARPHTVLGLVVGGGRVVVGAGLGRGAPHPAVSLSW